MAAIAQAHVLSVEERFAEGQPPLVVVHRSADLNGLPENSLAWITHAIELGIEAVHINPQLTSDGHYVLMHDATLNRTTDVEQVYPEGPPGGPSRAERGGKDYVRDYTLDQIQALHLLHADGQPEPVPTLAQALDLINGRMIVLIGLKTYEIDSLGVPLEGRDTRNLLLFQLYYSGTDQSTLKEAAEATGLDVAVVLYQSRDYIRDLERIHAQIAPHLRLVSVGSSGLTPGFIRRMEQLGLRMMISGWNGPEDSALRRKADPQPWLDALHNGFAVFTDLPVLLLPILER